MTWVILLARYKIVWLGFMSVVILSSAGFTSLSSSFPRPIPFFGWETLSQGRGWCESFPRNEVVVFRLYLYRMDLVLIRQSRPFDDAWFGNLRGCLGNFRNHPVRILCDRRHRMSPYLGVENFRSQLLVTRCIRNAVLDRCPHIPSFAPRSLGPCRCCRCHPLGLALVVSCWLRYGATFRHSSSVYVLPLRLM